jgi:hypothetical protein
MTTTITPSARLKELAAKCEQSAWFNLDRALARPEATNFEAVDRVILDLDRAAALRAHAQGRGK